MAPDLLRQIDPAHRAERFVQSRRARFAQKMAVRALQNMRFWYLLTYWTSAQLFNVGNESCKSRWVHAEEIRRDGTETRENSRGFEDPEEGEEEEEEEEEEECPDGSKTPA